MARKNEAKWKRIVASVKAGSKGGKSGQWSARKAQLATLRYKKSGGTYTGPKTKAQKSLSKWTKEDWGTKSGKPSTQGSKATGERYLPKKVREGLTKKEYEKTSAKKRADTKKGKQVSKQPKRIAKKTSKLKGPSMEGYKDDERRYARAERKISKAKEKSPEKGVEIEKKYGYNYDAAISAGLSPDSTGHWPSRDPATGMILKGRKHPTFYKTKAGEKAAGYKIYKKDGDMYSKLKGANMKGVPHYKKDGTEYKGATHKSGKQLMSGKTHTSSSVNLFHKKDIPGPNSEGNPTKKKNINLSTTFQGKKSSVTPSVMIKDGKPTSGSITFSKNFKGGHSIGGGVTKAMNSPTNINFHANIKLSKKGPNLVGNQSKIDMNRDGKITKKDFDMLNRGPSMQGSWMRKHVKG